MDKETARLIRAGVGRVKLARLLGLNDKEARQLIASARDGTDQPSRVVVISDVHIPYEDKGAVAVLKKFLKDYQPDGIVFLGDILDFYKISRYQKDAQQRLGVQEECDATHDFLKEILTLSGNPRSWYVIGNHCERLVKYLRSNAPELETVRGLNIQSLLRLDELGITYVAAEQQLWIGEMLYTHGHKALRGALNSVRAHYRDYGCSMIIGHVHRLAVGYIRSTAGRHVIVENGTLCQLDVDYMKFPDWQQGFTVIEYDQERPNVYLMPIVDDTLSAFGKLYRA